MCETALGMLRPSSARTKTQDNAIGCLTVRPESSRTAPVDFSNSLAAQNATVVDRHPEQSEGPKMQLSAYENCC
jgi:hypothetical protein